MLSFEFARNCNSFCTHFRKESCVHSLKEILKYCGPDKSSSITKIIDTWKVLTNVKVTKTQFVLIMSIIYIYQEVFFDAKCKIHTSCVIYIMLTYSTISVISNFPN